MEDKFRKCHEPHLRDYPDCFEECGCDVCEAPLFSEVEDKEAIEVSKDKKAVDALVKDIKEMRQGYIDSAEVLAYIILQTLTSLGYVKQEPVTELREKIDSIEFEIIKILASGKPLKRGYLADRILPLVGGKGNEA